MALSAAIGAVANGAIPLLDAAGLGGVAPTLALRFITGAALAGVYPPGMKLVATWCKVDRGLGIGILIGALTLGSAGPHLLNALPVLLLIAYERAGWSVTWARIAGFSVIAVGAVGCLAAGFWADRVGRVRVTTLSLAVSGGCCLVAGLFFNFPGLLTAVCLIWGLAVVADSAQFSAALSELADPRYMGTVLTLQTSLGFLLTVVTLRLIPALLDVVGWRSVFVILALGPLVGIVSMQKLGRLPEALRMAGGNR